MRPSRRTEQCYLWSLQTMAFPRQPKSTGMRHRKIPYISWFTHQIPKPLSTEQPCKQSRRILHLFRESIQNYHDQSEPKLDATSAHDANSYIAESIKQGSDSPPSHLLPFVWTSDLSRLYHKTLEYSGPREFGRLPYRC